MGTAGWASGSKPAAWEEKAAEQELIVGGMSPWSSGRVLGGPVGFPENTCSQGIERWRARRQLEVKGTKGLMLPRGNKLVILE